MHRPSRPSTAQTVTVILVALTCLIAVLPASIAQQVPEPVDEPTCVHIRQGCEAWTARYDGPPGGREPTRGWDEPRATQLSPDGSTIAVTGKTMQESEGFALTTVAYDAQDGAQQWEARFARISNGEAAGQAVAFSPDSTTVAVTGVTEGDGTSWDVTTIAYDAITGEQAWVHHVDGTAHGLDNAAGITIGPHGEKAYVLAKTIDEVSGFDMTVLAYDLETGDLAWTAQHEGPGDFDIPHAIELAPDGSTVYAIGMSKSAQGDRDAVVAAFDASTGDARWVASYDGPGQGTDTATAGSVAPDGSTLYVTGLSEDANGRRMGATVALDAATGEQRWVRRHANGYDVASGPSGEKVYVTHLDGTSAFDAASGERQWLADWEGPTGRQAWGVELALEPEGEQVIVAHNTYRVTSGCIGLIVGVCGATSVATVALDAGTGELSWDAIYDEGETVREEVRGLALGAGGSVYVATFSDGDYQTLAYASDGMPAAQASVLR